MKINYKALWIDDHPESISPDIENLTNKLATYGFKFDVEKRETISPKGLDELVDKLSNYNPYDMIIFDYDLGQLKGDTLASELRQNIYTDMIFYSGNLHGELRKALFDQEVDGVYIVSRPNFVDEAWPIIEDQIRRICDINNMRGLILDEMSEIDLKLRDLLCQKYKDLSAEEKEVQQNKVKNRLSDKVKNFTKLRNELDDTTFEEYVKNPLKIEFDIIRTRLSGLLDEEILGEVGDIKRKQSLRNKFAHNKTEYDEDAGLVKLNGYDDSYDFDVFTDIRKELIEIKSVLNSL